MTTTASDRMQLRGLGDLMHPGACAVCGSGNNQEGYVDTGIYFDYEGQVYLCVTCAEQLAEVVGCLTRTETAFMKEQLSELAAKVDGLTTQLGEANERLAGYDAILGSAVTRYAESVVVASNSEPQADSGSELPDGNDSDNVTGPAAEGEPVVKEPVKVQRRSDAKRPELRDGLDL